MAHFLSGLQNQVEGWRPALDRMLTALTSTLAITANSTPLTSNCSPARFGNVSLPGADILSVSANPAVNHSTATLSFSPLAFGQATVSICNVTVTYTHPGWEDEIHTTVWLPLSDWNGRLQGMGGGGYAASIGEMGLAAGVVDDFAVVGTDAGHTTEGFNSTTWSLDASSGHVNLANTQDFFSIALHEASVIAKQAVEQFYGSRPKYSYFTGCSTGGRQGMMLAQRFPTAYDGILSGAPAINWASFLPAGYYPQHVMNQLNTYPPQCVFDAITNASVKACDGLDGVVDDIISAPGLCSFDPHDVVGQEADCNGTAIVITAEAATIAQKTREGLRAQDGSFLWYGFTPGTPFRGSVNTECTTPTNCTGAPFSIFADWISRFVKQDPSLDLTSLTSLDTIFHMSYAAYESIASSNNPDLFDFKNAGSKLLHWHGMTDQLTMPNGSSNYFERVEARDPAVRDYYRFFEAPGVQHCGNGAPGNGLLPSKLLASLMAWVEEGTAPDTIPAVSVDGSMQRDLCMYPLVPAYQGGDKNVSSSYACAASF